MNSNFRLGKVFVAASVSKLNPALFLILAMFFPLPLDSWGFEVGRVTVIPGAHSTPPTSLPLDRFGDLRVKEGEKTAEVEIPSGTNKVTCYLTINPGPNDRSVTFHITDLTNGNSFGRFLGRLLGGLDSRWDPGETRRQRPQIM